jgi:hypothetical protein
MAVSVIVNTVVFASRSPSRRMVAFRIPIARPVNTMTRYTAVEGAAAPSDALPATVADMNSKAPSEPKAAAGQRCVTGFIDLANRTPSTAPIRNAPTAVTERPTDNDSTPATAYPSNTTLPVMFAVKTWPNAR